jgi:hypothetical protein
MVPGRQRIAASPLRVERHEPESVMARPRSSVRKYPFATLALYGPDTMRATKLVAAVFRRPSSRHAEALESWAVDAGDVRADPVVASHVAVWLKQHGVRESIQTDRIIGCPHEEGIDYPMGRACPRCPFWADIDRFTYERIRTLAATMSPDDVLERLSSHLPAPRIEALEAADAHRAVLLGPLLEALERGSRLGTEASDEEAQLFTHALYLLAKWREPRAYPLVLRWLSLPPETTDLLTGDVLTQDGARILAAVCDGDIAPIRELIVNVEADEFSRAVAIGALSLLAAWAELPRDAIVKELGWLADEGLDREPSYVWGALAARCADIEALEVFPALRRAYDAGLVDAMDMAPEELDHVESAPRGVICARTREREPPIADVAEATSWWGNDDESSGRVIATGDEPYRASPKVGRNEPCPCGSGRKYKKCCGA